VHDEAGQPGEDKGWAAGEQAPLRIGMGGAVEPQISEKPAQAYGDEPDGGRGYSEPDADGESGNGPAGRRVENLSQ